MRHIITVFKPLKGCLRVYLLNTHSVSTSPKGNLLHFPEKDKKKQDHIKKDHFIGEKKHNSYFGTLYTLLKKDLLMSALIQDH